MVEEIRIREVKRRCMDNLVVVEVMIGLLLEGEVLVFLNLVFRLGCVVF